MAAEDEIPVVAALDGDDPVTALSALESLLSLLRDTLQLASLAFQFVPAMTGAAGILSGISSGFGKAGQVLDGIDQIVEIYGQHPEPAGISVTKMLNSRQSLEQTLARCGEIVERYGADPDPAVVVDVLVARLNRVAALTGLQRFDEALSGSDEIVSICRRLEDGDVPGLDAQVRQDHVVALAIQSVILLLRGKPREALAACDEVVTRFGADQRPQVRSAVAWCLLARAWVLHRLERWQEEIDAYDAVVAACSADRSLRGVALNARYGLIVLLLQLGRFQDAVQACDETRRAFSDERLVRVATSALEVDGYRGLGQHEKAVKACDTVVDLIGSATDLGSRLCVAHVLLLKAQSLWALDRGDEVPPVCEDIDRRFGSDPDQALRQEVARALLYKGALLVQRERWDEAAAAMDLVVSRYGTDPDPALREMTARARSRLGALRQLGAGPGE